MRKKFKKQIKNGFTLIELLAVIVILAIIALIATPRIMAAIEEARTNSFKNSVYGIVKAGELLYAESVMSEEALPRNENILDQIDFNGEQPDSGEVIVSSDGVVKAALVYGDKCFLKTNIEVEVLNDIEECVLPLSNGAGDVIAPEFPQILVIDENGNPIEGIMGIVHFGGGASIMTSNPGPSRTDENGIATLGFFHVDGWFALTGETYELEFFDEEDQLIDILIDQYEPLLFSYDLHPDDDGEWPPMFEILHISGDNIIVLDY